jgi:hypothetical protein
MSLFHDAASEKLRDAVVNDAIEKMDSIYKNKLYALFLKDVPKDIWYDWEVTSKTARRAQWETWLYSRVYCSFFKAYDLEREDDEGNLAFFVGRETIDKACACHTCVDWALEMLYYEEEPSEVDDYEVWRHEPDR